MSRFDDNLSVFKRLRAGQQYGERKRGVIGRLDADGRIDADISAGLPAASVWLTLQGERAAVPAKNLRVENAPGLPVIAARSLDTGELEILGVDSLTAVDQFGAAAAGLNSPRKGASIPTPILARDVVTGGVFASGGLTVRMGAFWHAGGYWADSTALTLVPTAAADRKALVLVGVNKRTNAAATALTADRAALLPLISDGTPNATAWADIKAVIDAQPHIEWRGAVELANGATSIDPTQIAPLHWRHSTLMGADGVNAGASGLVPQPAAADSAKFLRGDATWADVAWEAPGALGAVTPNTINASNAGGFRIRNVTNTDWVEVIKGRIGGSTIRIGSPNNTFELIGTAINFYDSAVSKRAFTMPATNAAQVLFNPDYESAPTGNHYLLFYGGTSGRTLLALYANGRDSINFGTQSTETGHFVSMRSVMTTQRTQRWDKLTNQNADLWQVRDESANELLTLAPLGTLTVKPYTNASSALLTALTLGHNTSAAAGAGFGGRLTLQLESSTTENVAVGGMEWLWNVATHASRVPDLAFKLTDYGGTREIMRLRATGTAGAVGFFGATPAGQQVGGAASAGAVYGAGEQTMLQAVYDALRAYGLLS